MNYEEVIYRIRIHQYFFALNRITKLIQPAVVCMYLNAREYYINCNGYYQIHIYLHLYPICFLRFKRIFVSVFMGHIFPLNIQHKIDIDCSVKLCPEGSLL